MRPDPKLRVWTERERIAHVRGCLTGMGPTARTMRDMPLPQFGYDHTVKLVSEILFAVGQLEAQMDLAMQVQDEREEQARRVANGT